MALTSARVKKADHSWVILADHLATERLFAFTGVTPCVGSTRTGSTAGGVVVGA